MAMPNFEKPSNDEKIPEMKLMSNKKPKELKLPEVIELPDLRTKEERLMDKRIERVRKKMGKPPLGLRARYPITPDTPKVEESKPKLRPSANKPRPPVRRRIPPPHEVTEYDDQGDPVSYLKSIVKKKSRLSKKPVKPPAKSQPKSQKAKAKNPKTVEEVYQQMLIDAKRGKIKPPEDLPIGDPFDLKVPAFTKPKEVPLTEEEEKYFETPEIKSVVDEDISEPEHGPAEYEHDLEEMDYNEESSITPEHIPPSVSRRPTQKSKVPSHLPEVEVVEPTAPVYQEKDLEEVLRIGHDNRRDREREAQFVLEAERRAIDPQGLDQPILKGTPEGDAFEALRAKEKELETPEMPPSLPEIKPEVERVDEDFGRMMGEKPVGEEAKQSAWKKFKEAGADLGGAIADEIKEKFKPVGERLQSGAERAVNAWRFARERVKGVATFGFWEVHEAEYLRSEVKGVSKEASRNTKLLQREQNLTYDDEHEEANRMNNLYDQLGIEERNALPPQELYRNMANWVSAEKISQNKEIEQELVDGALSTLRERFAKKVDFRGRPILTEEKLFNIESELRRTASVARYTQIDRDIINYNKLIRKNLDPEWYRRYVAGGIEFALASVALGAVAYTSSAKIGAWWGGRMAKKALGTGVKQAAERVMHADAPTGTGSSYVQDLIKKFLTPTAAGGVELEDLPMPDEELIDKGDNIWNITKDYLSNHGIKNPTNAQILEAAKEVAKENNIAVKEWGISGEISDRQLRPGKVLSLKSLAAKAALLAGKKAVKAAVNIAMES